MTSDRMVCCMTPTPRLTILFTRSQIRRRVEELGLELAEFYRNRPLTMIVLVNGALMFAADLARAMNIPMRIDTLAVSSYRDDVGSGELTFRSRLKLDTAGRELLVVDEVLDSGVTLRLVTEQLAAAGALGVRTAVLVDKQRERPDGLRRADWTGFSAPDRYLVGCGLDSREDLRQLPYIAALD